ncbi:MAG: ATP-binding cassette domain-containing protein, partial [Clostridia bacterium]|nr:ATP-binding cassette domain-containing protein [Deltaproteobacteria bacterium]
VRTFLRMFLFDDRFADTPIGKLSGGERNRVQLTKLLRRGGNVLVLDEPTNDLDLITLGVLEEALMDFAGCALVVSHDRWFLDRVATGILAFEGGGKVGFYEGSYTDWLNRGGKVGKSSVEKKAVIAAKAEIAAKRQTHKLSYKDQRDLDGIENAIAVAEARSRDIEARLYGGTISATESSALSADLSVSQKDVERLYIRWTELEELVASLSK